MIIININHILEKMKRGNYMAFSAKVYKVLIASPSDVSEERELIPKILHEWNTKNSEHYKIVFLPIKWETHTIPTMGGRPQGLINKQIVETSDILIGAFWTKLGTHTGVAESGTVEEITEFMEQNKKVMLYFSNKPVMPDSIDYEQYQRLKDFKTECQSKGLYDTYDSSELLKEKVTNHLTLFANEHDESSVSLTPITNNQLSVAFYNPKNETITNSITGLRRAYSSSTLIKEKIESLKQLIHKVSSINLPKKNDADNNESIDNIIKFNINSPIIISNNEQAECYEITKQITGIELKGDFFDFGDLKKSTLNLAIGGGTTIIGTNKEKEKYDLFRDYEVMLFEIKGFLDYFNYLDGFSIAPLILSNIGHQYNESIIVKLTFPKNVQILTAEQIEKPNYYVIEYFTNNLLESILKPKETSDLLEYYCAEQYKPALPITNIPLPFSYKESFEDKLKTLHAEFEDETEQILYFSAYISSDAQVLKFTFDELNPSTSMWFPCYLLIKANETFDINYEITSKNLTQKITGTLKYEI